MRALAVAVVATSAYALAAAQGWAQAANALAPVVALGWMFALAPLTRG
jgi:hypothetical protein